MPALLRIVLVAAMGFLPLAALAQAGAPALTEQDARNIAGNNGIVAVAAIKLSDDQSRHVVGGAGAAGEQMVLEIGAVTRRQ